MKPSFALHITDTAIGLLHRTARGWLQVGETAFDTADLAEALGYLRGSALGLSPGGLTTKLVLPNSQIKYLELEAAGPSDSDRRNQIRAALVGKTPYNVEDLVFDWSGTGSKVQVAVVARETLDEAEAFATEHRFNPVSFVGQPLKGDFKGEPWFGPTKASASLLEKGEKVDRDAEAVQIAGRDLPKSHPGAAKSSSGLASGSADNSLTKNDKQARDKAKPARTNDADADAAPEVASPPMAGMENPAGRPDSASVSGADADTQPAFVPAQTAALDRGLPIAEPVKPAQPDMAKPEATQSVTRNQAFLADDSPAAQDDDLPPAPSAAIMAAFASRRAGEPTAPTPRVNAGSVGGAPAPLGGSDLADRLAGKSAPPPLSRPMVAPDLPRAAPAQVGNGQTAPISGVTPSVTETARLKSVAGKPNTAFVTAPNIPGSRKRKSSAPEAAMVDDAANGRKSLTKPGGTFASSKQRGKPRYLGVILTILLLVFLALIAAWSSFFLASNTATKTGVAVVDTPQAVAVPAEIAADVPAVDDEMLADGQELAAADPDAAQPDVAPVAEGAPETPLAADVPAAAEVPAQADVAAADTTVSAANTPEPAPVVAATTDAPSSVPLAESQDEIFLTAIDAPPLALDPLTLPQPGVENDALPLPQLEPPPFGTVYQFDADGRIRATPEGIITPEGVRLVAGKPSILPPPRPAAVAQTVALPDAPVTDGTIATAGAAVAVPAAALPFPSDPALADARPRTRPAGLAPAAQATGDGASLATPATTRVASLRPQARPAAILAAGEAARQSTANASIAAQAAQAAAVEAAVEASFQPDPNASPLAVAVSRKPAPRPKDMSRAVEAAVAAAVRAPEPQVEQTNVDENSEPELASVAPSIPSRASVAKQATYVNAINLSKINLIGVYGSKSKPYALIRQANGRYKKVKVGDAFDGGKVAAIGPSEVRYQKSGRMISLKMPRT